MGINNSLTTANTIRHRLFLQMAIGHIQKMAMPAPWEGLAYRAESILEDELRAPQTRLAPLVRSLCLRVVMRVLFGPACGVINKSDVTAACSEINKQWMLSKQDVDSTQIRP